MKKVLPIVILILSVAAFMAFRFSDQGQSKEAEKVQWYTWKEAIELSDKEPKKLFIDMYTNWCGWCKRMDATTFTDPKVVQMLNNDFYAVKFNAEQKEPVAYKGHTFTFIDSGRRGVHELAYSLLEGRLGYPSYVYMDEQQKRITISPGYKPVDKMVKELEFIKGEHYKKGSFQDYLDGDQ